MALYNPMQSLIGLSQAAAIGAPDPLAPPPQEGPPMEEEEGYIDANADLDRYVNTGDIMRRDVAAREGAEASDRRGTFGQKGTLRNILGVLGDAFLVQGGAAPMYGPRREQEKLSDAMAGFSNDPQAAIERVAGINPGFAKQLMDEYLVNQDRQTQRSLEGAKQQQAGLEYRDERKDMLTQRAASLLTDAVASGDNRVIADAVMQAAQMAEAEGINLEQIGVAAGMTPQELQRFINSTVEPDDLMRIRQGDERVDISRQNANTARERLGVQREAEQGRNVRASQSESGRMTRAEMAKESRDRRSTTRDSGPRQLRQTSDRPRFSPNR